MKTRKCVDHVAIRHVEQAKDQHEDQRHDDQQPGLCPLQVFELAAVLDAVAARRQRDLFGDFLLGFGDEAAQVAAADVGCHREPPLTPFARDRRGTFDDRDLRQPRQGNPFAARPSAPRARRSPRGCARSSSTRRATSGKRSCPSTTSPSGLLPDRLDQIEHRLGRDAVAGDLVLVDFDLAASAGR